MSTPVPIVFSTTPLPAGAAVTNLNELLTVVAQYLTGTINQEVDFFLKGTVVPDSNQGVFFNETTGRFMVWNATQGKYLPITDLEVGDVKQAYTAGDDLTGGWVVLDGRVIEDIPGITQDQLDNLQTLFGATPGSKLPTRAALSSLSNLPADGAIGGITVPETTPADGIIGALPIADSYDDAQIINLRDNTEVLRDSSADLVEAVKTLRDKTEQLRDALADSGSTNVYTKVWIGFP